MTDEVGADITERLRRAAPFMRATGNAGIVGQHADTCEEAANEIEGLRRERDVLIDYLNGISRQTGEMVHAHSAKLVK